MKNRRKDLTGQKFGRLTVLSFSHYCFGQSYYICQCECGKRLVVRRGHLLRGTTKSCGCLQRERTEEYRKRYVGKKFGEISVLSFSHYLKGYSFYNCKCSCGTKLKISSHYLRICTKRCHLCKSTGRVSTVNT
jgi:hypothetical protein